MLFMDPQVFRLTHATHHTKVNTYEDLQIHPLGRISNRPLRILYNFLEIAFGDMHFMIASTIGVIRHPRLRRSYSIRKAICWHLTWILSLTAILFASSQVFGLTAGQVFFPTLIGMWICALVLRHNEMVQHANIIVDGTLEERNLKTRNMLPVGVAERVFLFLTHNDPRHHVLHHTLAKVYSRPFPDTIPMPDGAVYVTMKGYVRVLGQMLLGK
jgi:fatty acid desaturase